MSPSPEEAVDAIQDHFGRYPASRAAHAKGTLCNGVFRPSPEAGSLTTAEHMRLAEVPVTVRFSNSHGNPGRHDGRKDVRGMATRFYLDVARSRYTDLLAVTLPCFFVRTADDFVAMNRALAQKLRLVRFLIFHREAVRATWASFWIKRMSSYANCRFNALHTFRWIDEDGVTRYVRYSWIPLEGEKPLPKGAEPMALGRDYLQEDLVERLAGAHVQPIEFKLELQIAADGDELFDPTAVWPRQQGTILAAGSGEARDRLVDGGVLAVTGIDYGTDADQLGVFDPTRLLPGIEAPPEDEILQFRPGAYGVSLEQRTA